MTPSHRRAPRRGASVARAPRQRNEQRLAPPPKSGARTAAHHARTGVAPPRTVATVRTRAPLAPVPMGHRAARVRGRQRERERHARQGSFWGSLREILRVGLPSPRERQSHPLGPPCEGVAPNDERLRSLRHGAVALSTLFAEPTPHAPAEPRSALQAAFPLVCLASVAPSALSAAPSARSAPSTQLSSLRPAPFSRPRVPSSSPCLTLSRRSPTMSHQHTHGLASSTPAALSARPSRGSPAACWRATASGSPSTRTPR